MCSGDKRCFALLAFKISIHMLMLEILLGLKLEARFDTDRRQGLLLVAGLFEWKAIDEPVPV